VTVDYSIDRTTFRQLVDVALRKIPTASRGNWTLHAPVDPGITLVELFAWLLEQRSYWADQVTAPLVRRAMAMFGGDLRGARPAGVAITFEPELADPVVPSAQISRRTTLRVPETELVFTLQHGLTALALARYKTSSAALIGAPVVLLEGVAGYGAEDLRSGRPVPLLPAGGAAGRAAEARIGIALREPPPAKAASPISILVELDTAVLPEWHPDAVQVSPPAQLRWEYQDTAGAWLPLPRLCDGTLGLRRSGLVRFALPERWSAYGEARVGWLRVATDDASFSSPPTVLRIVPNTALAHHLVWRTHSESPGWLPLPARTVQLPATPLPLPDRVFLLVNERDRRRRWHAVPDLVLAGPADRMVVVDRARARIVFGDGLTGRVPRLAEHATPQVPQVMVRYAAGGGLAGNVAPCAWETVAGASGAPGVGAGSLAGARSLVAAVGGRDPETLDEARARAAAALQVPERAITPHDHEVIACSTPGVAVARAHAEVGFLRGECGVVPGVTTVFVVPGDATRTVDAVRDGRAGAAPVVDPGALAEVRRRLTRARLVGETIIVEPVAYRHVRVRVTVVAAPADREGLRQRLGGALRLFLDPLLGGEDQTGWPFGEPVRPTALLGVAQRALGDRGDITAVGVMIDPRSGLPSGRRSGPRGDHEIVTCADVTIRPYELVAVDAIDVVISAARAAEGGLR